MKMHLIRNSNTLQKISRPKSKYLNQTLVYNTSECNSLVKKLA